MHMKLQGENSVKPPREFITLEDVIKFAVKREDTAHRLYSNAASRATSISSRKMFEELAVEEMGHKHSFEKLDFGRTEPYTFAAHPDMKLAEYMVDMPFREDMTYDEILRFAMKTEEAAYKLYTAAAEMTSDAKLRKMLLVLADVEKGHKQRIEALYDEHVMNEN
jgi:rubrerythrin